MELSVEHRGRVEVDEEPTLQELLAAQVIAKLDTARAGGVAAAEAFALSMPLTRSQA